LVEGRLEEEFEEPGPAEVYYATNLKIIDGIVARKGWEVKKVKRAKVLTI
jgi:hypothetical protein